MNENTDDGARWRDVTETDKKLCKERTEPVVLTLVFDASYVLFIVYRTLTPSFDALRCGWNTRPKRSFSVVICCLPFFLFYSPRCWSSSIRSLLICSNCFRAAWFSFSLRITLYSLSYVLHLLFMSYTGPFSLVYLAI